MNIIRMGGRRFEFINSLGFDGLACTWGVTVACATRPLMHDKMKPGGIVHGTFPQRRFGGVRTFCI